MLILIVAAVIAVFFVMGIYNGLIRKRNMFKNAFAQIDVQLKRRYDLIPNLVSTAKGYMSHERETLEAVISARSQAVNANAAAAKNPADAAAMQGLLQAEGGLTGVMSKFMMLTENYPDLKADSQMSNLMEELTTTENKISFARQAYNDAVMLFNNAREVFPNNIIAGMFNFKAAALFEIKDAASRENVKVSF